MSRAVENRTEKTTVDKTNSGLSPLKVGLFGFGCAGEGLYQTLENHPYSKAVIKRICIADPSKERSAPAELFTTSSGDIFGDENIDVIVELIDDAQAAFDIIDKALRANIPVVSANKKVIAENLEYWLELQKTTGTPLLYEAACGAGIPTIRSLSDYFDSEWVQNLEGVVNGSTNYILSQLSKGQAAYDEALAEAQAAGFAETDPSLDVEGWDSRYKLCLLLAHAFGLVVRPEDIFTLGITRLQPSDFEYASQRGQSIKLVATAQRVGETVEAFVLPKFVSSTHPLSRVSNEINGLQIGGALGQNQFLSGAGAGAWPTASGVLNDLSALAKGYKYKEVNSEFAPHWNEDPEVWVHFAADHLLQVPVGRFEEVITHFHGIDGSYIQGRIKTSILTQLLEEPRVRAIALDAEDILAYKNKLKQLQTA
jgi:homoserine dehydrogenase